LKAVQEISLDELDALSSELEAAVDATPLIDPWCSGPDWQIPVAAAFAPGAERLILATEDRTGFAMLSKYDAGHPLMGGIEPLWGFGTPIVGPNPARLAAEVAATLAARDDWQTLFLPGMPTLNEPTDEQLEPDPAEPWVPRPDPTVTLGLASGLASLGRVGLAEGITRRIADLRPNHSHITGQRHDDQPAGPETVGPSPYEQWLGRRTARFRRNLRQADARADSEGVTIEDASADPHLFNRLMAIEHQTWKGQEGSGITSEEMSALYRLIIDRLARSGRLQAAVARHRDVDVGYILGGIRNRRYRGLQLSYTDAARHLSVGNLLQNHQIKQLDEHDLADVYDLGMDFDYKKRWADRTQTSVTLVVHRR
jgi:hypothetical protein